jgi:thiol-disulfide isomerase/thioredoxin
MAQLEVLEPPVSLVAHVITYPDGTEHALEEKKGKVLLVNLWAKWCAPGRAEMKDFSRLQTDLGDDRFEVVVLPMKKRSTRSAQQILTRWGAENLRPYTHDPEALAQVLHDQGLSEDNKVAFVLPTTYLVGRDGGVLAMREGFLDWDTPEARALIEALKEEIVPPKPVP